MHSDSSAKSVRVLCGEMKKDTTIQDIQTNVVFINTFGWRGMRKVTIINNCVPNVTNCQGSGSAWGRYILII